MRIGLKEIAVWLMMGLFSVLAADNVRADDLMVLWWQVGDAGDEEGYSLGEVAVERVNNGGTTTAAELGVTHARIKETNTGTYLKIMDTDNDGNFLGFTLDSIDVPIMWIADVSAFSGEEYAFVIELGNYESGDWSTLAISETRSYADLSEDEKNRAIAKWTNEYAPAYVTPWAPTAYVVPEPSSGLLVLVGAALLALRRRRES